MVASARWQRATSPVSERDVVAINAGVRYLWRTVGPQAFRGVLPDSLVQRLDSVPNLVFVYPGPEADVGTVVDYLGVERRSDRGAAMNDVVSIERTMPAPMSTVGFEYVTRINGWAGGNSATTGDDVGAGFRVRLAADSTALDVVRDSVTVVRVPLDSVFLDAARQQAQRPRVSTARLPWTFEGAGGGLRVRIFLNSASVRGVGAGAKLTGYAGYVLLDTGS
jgi:hypothetical protein